MKVILKNVFLGTLPVLLVLGGLEIFVRNFYSHEVDTDILQKDVDQTRIASFTQPSSDWSLMYELKPNVIVQWKGVTIKTDRSGWSRIPANKEIKQPIEDASVKIALVGDSTAFGWGVQFKDSYGEVLENKLEEYFNDEIELRNFAVPGYNSKQNYTVVKKRVVPWGADLLILHYDHNDADPIIEKPVGYMPPEYGNNFIHSALIKFVFRRIRKQLTERLVNVAVGNDGIGDKFFMNYRFSGPQYDEHIQTVKKTIELANKNNITVLVYIFNTFVELKMPVMKDPMYIKLHQNLVPILSKQECYVVDGYMENRTILQNNNWSNLKQTWLTEKDAHPNQLGHRLIAESIFDFVVNSQIKELFHR